MGNGFLISTHRSSLLLRPSSLIPLMPLTLPNLDDRTYDDLVAEALRLIPVYAPEWTNHNPSDPGITLIELLAYLSEMLLYRQNRITDDNVRMFLKLLNGSQWQPTKSLNEEIRSAVLAVRQRYRTITVEDFEALAIAAYPDVKRAHCLPRRDLTSDNPLADAPAHVSVIIVPTPEGADPTASALQPIPTPEMMTAVATDLEPRRLLTTQVHVVAPRYVSVGVQFRFILQRDALETEMRSRIVRELQRFLHPLTGGKSQQGWPFGRNVYVSEIYDLLDRLPGVDYVTKRDNQDELIVDDNERDRLIRNDSGELVAIALQPHELVHPQIDPTHLLIESPILSFESEG